VKPDLSVIIPCYRSADLALTSVVQLVEYLRARPGTWEIVVVDDGGDDFPADAWPDLPEVRLLRLSENLGKGAAVRAGMLSATGKVRIFTDVDIPYDLELLQVIAHHIDEMAFHVVVGDRTLPGSSYAADVDAPRRVMSGMGSFLIGRVVTGGFFDTQCGLKGLRGDIADALFPLIRIDRFAFDIELVYIALKHRLDIKRVPVQLRRNTSTSVRVVRDSIRSLIDLGKIKYHQLRGHYDSVTLDAIVSGEAQAARDQALLHGRAPRDHTPQTTP